jgi:hypothetical protein
MLQDVFWRLSFPWSGDNLSDSHPRGTWYPPIACGYGPLTSAFGIHGAGHAANLTHPEELAEAQAEFFAPAQQPA